MSSMASKTKRCPIHRRCRCIPGQGGRGVGGGAWRWVGKRCATSKQRSQNLMRRCAASNGRGREQPD
eukprot:5783831-Alexandrium_andersonii.AAC.1